MCAVFENTYFTFFSDLKNMTFYVFFFKNDLSESHKRSLAKVLSSLLRNEFTYLAEVSSVITVIHFSYLFVSLVYLMTYRHLSHTVLICIVSCECEHYVRISEQRCLMLLTDRY